MVKKNQVAFTRSAGPGGGETCDEEDRPAADRSGMGAPAAGAPEVSDAAYLAGPRNGAEPSLQQEVRDAVARPVGTSAHRRLGTLGEANCINAKWEE